ncbi:hypothetical protein B4Q13_24935, partial [Lacticaseibacillus rhamnosus]
GAHLPANRLQVRIPGGPRQGTVVDEADHLGRHQHGHGGFEAGQAADVPEHAVGPVAAFQRQAMRQHELAQLRRVMLLLADASGPGKSQRAGWALSAAGWQCPKHTEPPDSELDAPPPLAEQPAVAVPATVSS